MITRKIQLISILFLSFCANVFAQLPTFEWRLENEQLTSSTTYQFDVNIYNTGSTSFEIRGGTIAFMFDSLWIKNGSTVGTITVTTPSSGLASGQQSSSSIFTQKTTNSMPYLRKAITSVAAGLGTLIPANSMVKCFTVVMTNSVAFSTTIPPKFAWKFTTPTAGFNYTDGSGNVAAVVSNTGTAQVIANQAFCYTPIYWTGTAWNTYSQTVTAGTIIATAPTTSQDVVIYNGTVTDGINCRNYNLLTGKTHTLNSGILNIAGNATVNGTLSSASGTIQFSGPASSLSTQTTNVALVANKVNVNSTKGISLGGSLTVNDTLSLTNGNIFLSNNNLIMGSSARRLNGSVTSYIVTNGTGTLNMSNIGGTAVTFPVGTSKGYNPVTLQNTGTTDNFQVSVIDTVIASGAGLTSNAVKKTWKITETNPGSSILSINLQWNAADELPSFNRASSYISFVNSSGLWQAGSQSAATGSSPYVQTLSGVVLNSSFSSFAVASGNVLNQQPTFTINASGGVNGSISPSGITTVNSNGTQRFTYTANNGYKVDSVIVDGIKVDSLVGFTFNNVTSNRTIRVTFIPIIYSINTQTNSMGTTNPSGNINIAYGGNQRILFTPNIGYKVDSVIVDGIKVDSLVGYTFINVTSNHTIRITFAPIIYSISVQTTSNGTTIPSGNINIAYGGSQCILFTPNTGYKVDSVIVDGIKVDSLVAYTFINVISNRTIRVTFIVLPLPYITISSIHPTGTYLNTNTSNNILASYLLTDSLSSSLLSGLSFTTQGTYTSTDIQSLGFKCWLNSTNDLVGATLIGTCQSVVASGGVIIFSGLSQNLPIGTSYILVTCDISNMAVNGNTIGLASAPIGNFTFTGNANINGVSNLAASNVFTINEMGPVKMQYRLNNNYSENFSDIANWTNGFASGLGVGRWAGVTTSAGTIPNASAITVSSANFQTSSSGAGIQRGSLTGNLSGTLAFLSLGNTDNTSSCAVDFFMDYTRRNADSLVFDAATVFNGVGNRNSTLRVYWSIDGTNFTELTGLNLPYTATNNVANSATIRAKLPTAFNNVSTCRLRFYYHNGTGGTTSSRPKISIDNVQVSAVCPIGISTNTINSCTPYTWNGVTYNASGVYNKTFPGASAWGCDSIANLNLNINTIVSFNPFQDTIKVCGRTYSLNSGAGYTSYSWSSGATTATISPTKAGWYKVTVSNGTCSASDSVYLSLNSAKINKNDTTVCPNVVFSLIATDSAAILPLTYLWGNGTTTSQIQLISNIPSTYYCTISNGINSCTDTSRVKINSIVSFNPFQDTIKACGTSYTLNAGSGYVSYVWNTSASTPSISPSNANLYKVTVSNGTCSASDSVLLSLVNANITNRDTTICYGKSITLNSVGTGIVSGSLSYLWSNAGNIQNITVSPAITTMYYCTISNGINSCMDSVKVTKDNFNPNLFIQDTLKVCGTSYTLNAGSGYTSYLWNTSATSQSINTTSAGWKNCIVSNGTCSSKDSVLLSMINANIINNDSTIIAGAIFTLRATGTGVISNPLTYMWSNGANTQNITISPTQKTTYYCTVSNGVSSCADSVKIGVNVKINLNVLCYQHLLIST